MQAINQLACCSVGLHREKSLSEDSVLAQSFVLYDGVSPPPPPASEDSEESVEALMISMLDSMVTTPEISLKISAMTVCQASSPLWKVLHNGRITSSSFGLVFH